jgi:hypothetical protein
VKEALDAIEMVAKGIENIRKIVNAVREGKAYLTTKHPEAKAHVAAMLAEMEKTMTVVARASAVLTHFWFTAKSEASLDRFNAQFQKHKEEADTLANNIDNLRGHCTAIKKEAETIEGKALFGRSAFAPIFERLGLQSKQREQELGELLHDLANHDFEVTDSAKKILEALNISLRAVQDALGPNRVMLPENIPAAGALLAEHAKAFEPLEKKATDLAKDARMLASELN